MGKRIFRAWYKEDIRLGQPLLFEQKEIDAELWFVCSTDSSIKYPFYIPFLDDDWIIQEPVGINDIKGVPIFEGDIVKTDEAGWVANVIRCRDSFMCIDGHGGFSSGCNWEEFKVIGNIYTGRNKND